MGVNFRTSHRDGATMLNISMVLHCFILHMFLIEVSSQYLCMSRFIASYAFRFPVLIPFCLLSHRFVDFFPTWPSLFPPSTLFCVFLVVFCLLAVSFYEVVHRSSYPRGRYRIIVVVRSHQ